MLMAVVLILAITWLLLGLLTSYIVPMFVRPAFDKGVSSLVMICGLIALVGITIAVLVFFHAFTVPSGY